jgi:Protein of unknown function (DUF3237)
VRYRVIPITGGHVSGERIKAEILPFGADWNLIQPNNVMFLSARYLLKTDDGVAISILNEGWARVDNAVMAKIMNDELVPEDSQWYCMIQTRFEAPVGKYQWLNESMFICEMLPPPAADTVSLIYWEVLR